ncbi:MAG: alpha/beta hydrolase [Alphaproteobacteria bacterium]|nr:alpha/beta hydrolase [Alphaproteobacteria bacterium]MCB9791185.1 alpha/beta hydrolase [Alphaproteobacteria bacterium]
MILLALLACAQPDPEPHEELSDLVYREVGGAEVRLDVYMPRSEGPHPAALLIHGGGFTEGDKGEGVIRSWARQAAARGWVVIAPNYRLTTAELGFPDPAQDLVCAARWAWAEGPGIESLSLVGSSSGATLGALSALAALEDDGCPYEAAPEPLSAMVLYYGVMDWPALLDDRQLFQSEHRFVGSDCLSEEDREGRCVEVSPSAWAQADAPPTLLLHADDDGLVPPAQSEAMQAALEAAGADAELRRVGDMGHGWAGQEGERAVTLRDEVLDWLELK